LRGFSASENLAEAGIKVVPLSVDNEATTVGTIEKFKLSFSVGHSADADKVASITGAYTNESPRYLQANGFLLAPEGKVLNAVYSSGPLGRLVAEEVIGMVRLCQIQSLSPPYAAVGLGDALAFVQRHDLTDAAIYADALFEGGSL
jgi:peroxiredoxin